MALEQSHPDKQVNTRDRRRDERVGTSAPGVLRDSEQRFIAKCVGINISTTGVFLMTHDTPELPRTGQVYLEMALPEESIPGGVQSRTLHRCRIVRVKQLGDLVGMGVELLEKLA